MACRHGLLNRGTSENFCLKGDLEINLLTYLLKVRNCMNKFSEFFSQPTHSKDNT